MLDSRFFFLRQHPHRSCISVASSCTITQKHFALSCIPQLKITLTWIVPRLTLLHLHWYQSDKRLFLLAEMFCSHDHGLCLSLSLILTSAAWEDPYVRQLRQIRACIELRLCQFNNFVILNLCMLHFATTYSTVAAGGYLPWAAKESGAQ
jgi:hypothetical protein